MEKNPNPEKKQNSQSIFDRLFPHADASGYPKDRKPLNLEELREDLRIFGDAEDLYRPQPIEPRA